VGGTFTSSASTARPIRCADCVTAAVVRWAFVRLAGRPCWDANRSAQAPRRLRSPQCVACSRLLCPLHLQMVGVFHEAYESAKASEEQTFMVIDLQAQPAAGPAPGGPAPGGGVARRMAEMSLAPAPMPAGLPAMSLAPSSVLEAMPETEADDEEADEGPSALLTTKRKRSARAGAAASASSLCREAPAMPGLPLGPSPCMSMAAPCAPSAMAPARSGPGGPGFGSTSDAFGAALTSSVLNSMNRRAKASTARSAPASSGPS